MVMLVVVPVGGGGVVVVVLGIAAAKQWQTKLHQTHSRLLSLLWPPKLVHILMSSFPCSKLDHKSSILYSTSRADL